MSNLIEIPLVKSSYEFEEHFFIAMRKALALNDAGYHFKWLAENDHAPIPEIQRQLYKMAGETFAKFAVEQYNIGLKHLQDNLNKRSADNGASQGQEQG